MATKKSASVAIDSYDDSKWRAQSDADLLSRAQEVMADKKRLSAAKASAREQAARLEKVVKCGAPTPAKSTAKPAAKTIARGRK
jgi:hypothetical protein